METEICTPETLAKIINLHKQLDVGSFVEAVVNELSLGDALDATNKRYLSIATRAVRIAALNGDSRDYASINAALTLEWNRLELTVLRGENSVKLMTIHQAKGLEFRSVFLPRSRRGSDSFQSKSKHPGGAETALCGDNESHGRVDPVSV